MMKKILSWSLMALAFVGALPVHAAGSSGIVDKLFIQNGTGAVPISQAEKLKQFVSAVDFGADKSGVTDSTAAIQAAINYGKNVYLPDGTYLISSGLVNTNGTLIYGMSPGSAKIRVSGNGYDALSLSADNASVDGVMIYSASARTAGAMVAIPGDTRSNRISNFKMQNGFIGISITGNPVITYIENGEILDSSPGTGVAISIGGGNDTYITKVVADSGGTQPLAGLQIKNTQAVWVTDSDFIHQGTGLAITPSSGIVTWCFFNHSAFDSNSNDAIVINPTGTAVANGLFFNNSWASTSLRGVNINRGASATVDGVYFNGTSFLNNKQQGALIQKGVNVEFNGVHVAGNSRESSGTYAGIDFANNVNNFAVKGSFSGNAIGFGETQSFGVLIGTGADNYMLDANTLTGNVTKNLLDNSQDTSTMKTVKGNLGAKTIASGTAKITSGTSEVSITHGLLTQPKYLIVTPLNSNMDGLDYWGGSLSPTTFKINTSGNVPSDKTFSWTAIIYD